MRRVGERDVLTCDFILYPGLKRATVPLVEAGLWEFLRHVAVQIRA
jgi:hypothetical protein